MSASVVETHSSRLFFVDDLVCKQRRALDLGFCDFRTRVARLVGCREEVRLNQRPSPDVYLGVGCQTSAGTDVDDAPRLVAAQVADLHRRSPAPEQLWDDRLDALEAFGG